MKFTTATNNLDRWVWNNAFKWGASSRTKKPRLGLPMPKISPALILNSNCQSLFHTCKMRAIPLDHFGDWMRSAGRSLWNLKNLTCKVGWGVYWLAMSMLANCPPKYSSFQHLWFLKVRNSRVAELGDAGTRVSSGCQGRTWSPQGSAVGKSVSEPTWLLAGFRCSLAISQTHQFLAMRVSP